MEKLTDQTLQETQAFQKEFDETYFQLNNGFEKTRHVSLHLSICAGKLAKFCEVTEHGKEPDLSEVLDEVVPDLLIHALQIANLYGGDLAEKYAERIQFIINRAAAQNK